MDLLKRTLAPILPEAWKAIDEEARRVLKLNLAGRKEYVEKAKELKAELQKLLEYAGEGSPEIKPATLYP